MIRRIFLFLALALLLSAPAAAQQNVVIEGTITDPSGALVPGAIVDALVAGEIRASSVTGQDGRYRLPVAAGPYRVRVRLQGFEDASADVNAAADVTHDLQLRIAAVGDSLVVTASRTAATRSSAVSSVSVFSAADIAALGSSSIADVLRFAPGLAVEANGREGALAAVFSRGGESDYNLVLIDGVRVNMPGGAYDFSRIAAGEIERVEVVRGGQSALYGSDAMGSVIQIFTRGGDLSAPPTVSGALEAGQFNTWRGEAGVAGGAGGRIDYHAGILHRRTEGAFADTLVEDDRFRQTSLEGRVGVVLGSRATARIGTRYSRAEGRAVGPILYGPGDQGTASDSEEWSWHLHATHRLASRVTGTATLAYSRNDTAAIDATADPSFDVFAVLSGQPGALFPRGPRLVRLVDAAAFARLAAGAEPLGPGEFLATTPFGVSDFPFTSRNNFRRPAFKYQADVAWARQTLTAGYEFERETDPLIRTFRNANHGVFVQQQAAWSDRVTVIAGARLDDNSRYGIHGSPRLSAAAMLLPIGRGAVSSLKAFTNVGTGIKGPVFAELFGSTFTDGNLDLEPERARTFDGGVEATLLAQRLRATATYFDNRYRDQVAFRSSGPGRDGQPDFLNIAGSKARGWEFEAVLQRAAAGITAGATYALIDTEVTATTSTSEQFQPGQPLIRRPRHSGTFRARYERGRAAVNMDVRFSGERHDAAFLGLATAASGTTPAGRPVDITVNPGYAVVGVGADVRLREDVSLFVRVENAGDRQYETALGFPGMPRAAVAGMRVSVRP
jgi:outer membrane cobalamin receptor